MVAAGLAFTAPSLALRRRLPSPVRCCWRRHATACVDRRSVLTSAAAAATLAALRPGSAWGGATSLDGPERREEESSSELPPFESSKLDPRVKIQEVKTGSGPMVSDGWRLSVNYVIRRSNGYFVDASYGFDRFETYPFTVGSGAVIRGFEIGVDGMQVGGRRRFVVPPSLGYAAGGTDKKSPGPIPPDWGNRRSLATHVNEPLLFEVALVRARAPPESD